MNIEKLFREHAPVVLSLKISDNQITVMDYYSITLNDATFFSNEPGPKAGEHQVLVQLKDLATVTTPAGAWCFRVVDSPDIGKYLAPAKHKDPDAFYVRKKFVKLFQEAVVKMTLAGRTAIQAAKDAEEAENDRIGDEYAAWHIRREVAEYEIRQINFYEVREGQDPAITQLEGAMKVLAISIGTYGRPYHQDKLEKSLWFRKLPQEDVLEFDPEFTAKMWMEDEDFDTEGRIEIEAGPAALFRVLYDCNPYADEAQQFEWHNDIECFHPAGKYDLGRDYERCEINPRAMADIILARWEQVNENLTGFDEPHGLYHYKNEGNYYVTDLTDEGYRLADVYKRQHLVVEVTDFWKNCTVQSI